VDPLWVTTAAVGGLLSGLVVPALLRRLPDPVPEIPLVLPPSHIDLASRPGLALRCAVAGTLAGAVLGAAIPGPWPLLLWLALAPFGLLLAVVDWHTQRLPRRVVLPLTAGAVLVTAVVELSAGRPDALVRALVGLVVARTLVWVLWFVRSAGMGFGDVRLTALLGFLLAHLGVGEAVVGLYSAFLLFGVPGLLLAIWRRDRGVLRTAYPFGPFLLAGAVLGAGAGQRLWSLIAG